MQDKTKAVYKFKFDCGRLGELCGLFIEEKRKVNFLIESGREVYFGECLGKHSEIYGPIDDGDVEMITDNPQEVELVEKLGLSIGKNPVEYYEDRWFNKEDKKEFRYPWEKN